MQFTNKVISNWFTNDFSIGIFSDIAGYKKSYTTETTEEYKSRAAKKLRKYPLEFPKVSRRI